MNEIREGTKQMGDGGWVARLLEVMIFAERKAYQSEPL